MMGNNHVWPSAPVFSFDTYQSGGDLNFKVISNTGIIATVINNNDILIHSSINEVQAKGIIAIGPGVNNRHDFSCYPLGKQIDISLPLYQRREVTVTGRGTSIARYGADLLKGELYITVSNDFDEPITFSANLQGITKTSIIQGQSSAVISFASLSAGDKLITIVNVTDNITEYVTVNINNNRTTISPIYYRFGAQSSLQIASNKLTRVDVYALTEAEALANNITIGGPSTGSGLINTSSPVENLLFNNTALGGHLLAVKLDEIPVNAILVQSQQELIAVQTDSINGQYLDIKTEKPSLLTVRDSKKFAALHGINTAYGILIGYNEPQYANVPAGDRSSSDSFGDIFTPAHSRLHPPGSWNGLPADGNSGWMVNQSDNRGYSSKWLQLNVTADDEYIVGVATQGFPYYNAQYLDGVAWTTSFMFKYSYDNINWFPVDNGAVFDGNTDGNTIRQMMFQTPVEGKFIRIYPQTNHIASPTSAQTLYYVRADALTLSCR
jgi:hypothetical protein